MILRPRQKLFVERSLTALDTHGNTLGVAPTGAGKTVMLSAVAGGLLQGGGKACILAHRDELTSQNEAKFRKVNADVSTSVVDANTKNWSGRATFAMVQTLCRPQTLDSMPSLDLLVVDEAHHITAGSYRRIIEKAQTLNTNVRIYGVTATPSRGDKKALREVFSNVADQIRIGELIASGHLVSPRTFVIDAGATGELQNVRKLADDFDMKAVEAVMNKSPVTDAVIRHWREKAGDRKTVVFCSTLKHAADVTTAFQAAGITAVLVHGELSTADRKTALACFENGQAQVVVNVAVLTEGWDYPPTSCVVLLRPSSFKSTMIQMIGRGLRTIDPEIHPGILKTDCVVLDFGTSTLLHGSLEQDASLDVRESKASSALTKTCTACAGEIPLRAKECPLCGAEQPQGENDASDESLADFVMTEIDLLSRSSFRWCDLFGDDAALLAQGFNAWAGVFFLEGRWHAVGGGKELPARLLAIGDRMVALAAADDWLNDNETDDSASKTRRWLSLPATDKQLELLPTEYRSDYGLTRYQASTLITFRFNRRAIQQLVFTASRHREAA
jgi:superfamily II DNA or RNA helicase